MAAELTDEQMKALRALIGEAMEWGRQYLSPAPNEVIEEAVQHYSGKIVTALSATGAEDAERPDPYIPLMADQAMSIDRHALRSALAWYGIAWREGSDEAFACYVGQYVNHLTTAIAAARTQSNGAAGGGEVSHGE